MMSRMLRWTIAIFLASLPETGLAADSGLVTMPSKYSVEVTVQRFEAAIREKSDQGWMVFTELDHAAAAEKNGLKLPARTVIVFGNPRGGTPSMQKSPTLAIDVPPKALVWQDDQGKVWLTFNSGAYLRTTCTPAMDYRPIRRQQRLSMNSSNTLPSKPRNNSPRTVILKLRSILSRRP